jgi:integrase/recombinase XerD
LFHKISHFFILARILFAKCSPTNNNVRQNVRQMKITYKFIQRIDGDALEPQSIYLQITSDRKNTKRAIGYKCLVSDWQEDREQSKSNHALNTKINKLKQKLTDLAFELEKGNKRLSLVEIADIVFEKESLEVYLLKYFENFVTNAFTTKRIQLGAQKHYMTCFNVLKKFVKKKFKRDDIEVNQIDIGFVNSFNIELHSLKRYYKSLPSKSLAKNTINGNYHKKLKAVLESCIQDDIITSNPYSKFKLGTDPTHREFLTEDELTMLTTHPLNDNDSLKTIRDIFIFSCFTGLRFDDAIKLTMDKIRNDAGQFYLYLPQKKTGDSVIIPLANKAVEIINKYDNEERKITNRVLPQRSNQKTNSYLKTIAIITNIDKNLTHHVARHTCATFLYNRGVQLEVIQKVLGHKNIRTTMLYVKMLLKTIQEPVMKAFDDFEKSESNKIDKEVNK